MIEVPNCATLYVIDVSISPYTTYDSCVKFKLQCECGNDISLRDHDKFCSQCGKPLPQFANREETIIGCEELFGVEGLTKMIEEFMKQHLIS